MTADITIKIRPGALREMRTSDGAQRLVRERSQRVANRAGDGYIATDVEITGGRGRARAAVLTATAKAMYDNAHEDTLHWAIDAARE